MTRSANLTQNQFTISKFEIPPAYPLLGNEAEEAFQPKLEAHSR